MYVSSRRLLEDALAVVEVFARVISAHLYVGQACERAEVWQSFFSFPRAREKISRISTWAWWKEASRTLLTGALLQSLGRREDRQKQRRVSEDVQSGGNPVLKRVKCFQSRIALEKFLFNKLSRLTSEKRFSSSMYVFEKKKKSLVSSIHSSSSTFSHAFLPGHCSVARYRGEIRGKEREKKHVYLSLFAQVEFVGHLCWRDGKRR